MAIDIFRSDTAPYFFALIVSAIGWFATSIAEETSSQPVAIYDIEVNGDKVHARIENVSRTAAIKDARFAFLCRGDRDPCFAVDPTGLPVADVTALPPLYTRDILPAGDAAEASFTVTMIARSTLDLTMTAAAGAAADVSFLYVPAGEDAQAILFIEKGDPVGWFLKNYLWLLVMALYVAAAILGC